MQVKKKLKPNTQKVNYRRAEALPTPEISKKYVDSPLLLIVILLLVTGMIALFTASYADAYYDSKVSSPLFYVINQGTNLAIGLVGMYFASKFDYKRYHAFGVLLYIGALILLVLVPIFSPTINGAQRWIFGFQPSEIMKTAIIMTFASFASRYTSKIRTLKGLFPYLCALGLVAGLLFMQPHISATIIICGVAFCILFAAGIKIWYLFPLGVGAAAFFVWIINVSDHAKRRMEVWINPFLDPQGDGFQGVQSHVAIGSGGLWGLGLGQSRQKHLYLPEPMNDFIFAIWSEELGFVGATLVVIMFAVLIWRGFYIACRSSDKFASLLAVGITSKIAIQALVNMYVVTGVFPVTGASLPFFSYGGTALIIQLCEIGVLLNISRHIKAKPKG